LPPAASTLAWRILDGLAAVAVRRARVAVGPSHMGDTVILTENDGNGRKITM
jgi:hypothetical protein